MSESGLDEEKLNQEIRKFLKKVGITSQLEIERAVREGLKAGQIRGAERLTARMTLEIGGLNLRHTVDGEIELG